MTNIEAGKWEPDARSEPEPRREPLPRTEPEPRSEPEPRKEPDARTESEFNKVLSVKCPSCGYLLIYAKGTKKQTVRCSKCGNVFQVE